MAVRYAVATGNWSNTATWNGGTLPTSADDVYSNTFTVTIDQSVTARSLNNGSTTGVTAGGSFACSTGQTIDCSVGGFNLATGTLLSLTNATGTTVVLKGNVPSHNVSGSTISFSGTGTVNFTGSIATIQNGGAAGNVIVSSTGTLNMTGDITLGGTSIVALLISSASTVNITGTIYGGISVTGSAAVSVTGNVAPTGGFAGVSGSGTSPAISIVGSLTAGTARAVAISSSGGTTTLTGPFYCSATGLMPMGISNPVKLTGATNNEFRFLKSTGGTTSLYSPDLNGGQPSAADVRYGTTYGVGNALTGTLRVPPTNSVASGVPVDATTGTAALSPADVAALVGAQITAALNSTP